MGSGAMDRSGRVEENARVAVGSDSTRVLAVSLLLLAAGCGAGSELPVLYAVPPASLVSDAGDPFELESLRGNVAIYDFIFTRCGATCPMMTRAMQRLIEEFDDAAPMRFVSVTVDPVNDTPEVLAHYAAQHRTDPRWVFLTGEREQIIRLSVDGFKLAAGGDPQPGLEPFLHTAKFVLVDPEGKIRGYYESGDREQMEKLVEDARRLLP